MRKQYRVLRSNDAVDEKVINKLAKEGFRIAFVAGGTDAFYTTLWMERDLEQSDEPLLDKELEPSEETWS